MEDLKIKLNSITKLKLFREVKKIIFTKMDSNKITTERAEEILNYIKKHLSNIDNPQEIKNFYIYLGENFSELNILKNKIKIAEKEKIDQIFSLFLDKFMEKWNIDLVKKIMEEMEESKNTQTYLEKLKKDYPVEFQNILEKIA
jgi:hypothetical protein